MVRLRPEISQIQEYQQGQDARPDAFKLSSNEMPFEPSNAVQAAIAEGIHAANLYPDHGAPALVHAIADMHSVDADGVALGAGSVEVLRQIVTAATQPGDEVLFGWPTYSVYPNLARLAGAEPVAVPLADDRYDLRALAAAVTARTRVALICNPNNPTGTTVTADAFASFLASVPDDLLVAVDEAYVEFSADAKSTTFVPLIQSHPNLAVLRTFSKAYGLAGLRVGYAIAKPEVIAQLKRTALPFGVADLAQRAAAAALQDQETMRRRVRFIIGERERITATLRALGRDVGWSAGNFIWLRTGLETPAVADALAEQGVIARVIEGEGVRVTVGTRAANDRFIASLAAIADGQNPGVGRWAQASRLAI